MSAEPIRPGDPRDQVNQGPLLASYLAGHDAACPACRYNLRGVTSANCPECGLTLRLGIHEAGGVGPRRGLLLLVFCWLLLAGGMNGYRALSSIYGIVNAQQMITIMPTLSFPAPPGWAELAAGDASRGSGFGVGGWLDPEQPVPFVGAVPGAVAGELAVDPALAQIDVPALIDARRRAFGPSLQLSVTRTAPALPTWSAVGWTQWLGAAWWTTMVLAALTGLALLVWFHRRPASRAVARTISAIAWCAFTGYFGYHLVHFVNEVL